MRLLKQNIKLKIRIYLNEIPKEKKIFIGLLDRDRGTQRLGNMKYIKSEDSRVLVIR